MIFNENKHTCQLSTIQIDKKEKIQDFFIDIHNLFLPGESHKNENKFLMEIYNGKC